MKRTVLKTQVPYPRVFYLLPAEESQHAKAVVEAYVDDGLSDLDCSSDDVLALQRDHGSASGGGVGAYCGVTRLT